MAIRFEGKGSYLEPNPDKRPSQEPTGIEEKGSVTLYALEVRGLGALFIRARVKKDHLVTDASMSAFTPGQIENNEVW